MVTTVWHGLDDFIKAMEYWQRVQAFCIASGYAEAKRAELFGDPYLDGDRVVIPNGLARAENSEGFRDESIEQAQGMFILREKGRSRGDLFDATKAWFSSLGDVCKHFTGYYVGEDTRSATKLGLPVINLRWVGREPAQGWSASAEPKPNGFEPATKYFRTDDPARFYFTLATDSETSYRLNMSWRELNETYAEGIPGVESVPLPAFSDD